MNSTLDIESLITLCKLKTEKPDEYAAFLFSLKGVMLDIVIIGNDVMRELSRD